jgi:hypothetical protein
MFIDFVYATPTGMFLVIKSIPVCQHKFLLPSSMLEHDSVLRYDNIKIVKSKALISVTAKRKKGN